MAISGHTLDNEKQKFKEAASLSGQPAVAVVNPDGSNIGTGSSTSGSVANVTAISDQATSTTLLAANTAALERIIQNDSTSTLYVKFGATAASTDYTVKLNNGDVITTKYTGRIDGIWSADTALGAARVTETQ